TIVWSIGLADQSACDDELRLACRRGGDLREWICISTYAAATRSDRAQSRHRHFPAIDAPLRCRRSGFASECYTECDPQCAVPGATRRNAAWRAACADPACAVSTWHLQHRVRHAGGFGACILCAWLGVLCRRRDCRS